MAGSVTTTRISLLEIGTDQNYDDEGTLFVPSGSTIEASGVIAAAGNIVATADVDVTGGDILFALSTSTPTTAIVGGADNALSLVSHSGNSMHIAVRSGVTVYTWLNSTGVVG